jgi:hypothetical protein
MKKLRLPKPAATNVVNRHLYIGSVYTNEQMQKFAEKAAISERNACLDLIFHSPPSDEYESPLAAVYKAILARSGEPK